MQFSVILCHTFDTKVLGTMHVIVVAILYFLIRLKIFISMLPVANCNFRMDGLCCEWYLLFWWQQLSINCFHNFSVLRYDWEKRSLSENWLRFLHSKGCWWGYWVGCIETRDLRWKVALTFCTQPAGYTKTSKTSATIWERFVFSVVVALPKNRCHRRRHLSFAFDRTGWITLRCFHKRIQI